MKKSNNAIVIFAGNSLTGKTSLINSRTNQFEELLLPTKSIDSYIETPQIPISENEFIEYKLNILDLPGQERYRTFASMAFRRNCDCIVLVYSINNRKSFENIDSWIGLINEFKDIKKIQLYLIGNKCDLIQEQQVSEEEGKIMAEKYGATFMLCSAKNKQNIAELFEGMIKKIYEIRNCDHKFGIHKKRIKKTRNHYHSVCPYFSDYYVETEEYEEIVTIDEDKDDKGKKLNKKQNCSK